MNSLYTLSYLIINPIIVVVLFPLYKMNFTKVNPSKSVIMLVKHEAHIRLSLIPILLLKPGIHIRLKFDVLN